MTERRNPMLDRWARTANLTASHKRSKKQEKALAGRVGGKLTPASGARDVKGDVRVKGILRIEAKTTKRRSFSVTLDMIAQIEDAAVSTGEMPVIIVEFITPEGKPIKEVAICPTYVLQEIATRS